MIMGRSKVDPIIVWVIKLIRDKVLSSPSLFG